MGICAWLHPIGDLTTATTAYQTRAFDTGFVNGYQTLDVQPGAGATNGMQVMSAYVETVFGVYGRVLLAGIYSA
ncbi:branched-chain amino acid transport system II carrier protein [Citrobacter sp. XY323]|uniref:branched-chain amino acid transport system II carrier protein n=1 Tax=Citrobacter sp. XY323 TaxID=2976537 RepID=UPI0021823966|nr:branched-chain amino acid transport system II carrier protein [Citrobacter sp. XY323]MCS8552935.1 branched-chain amino acid transport system II carrier protein [Citrobacter sp. XY323]